jgi:hypothetical protein
MTLDQLTDIIARGEQLDVEFKSDRRQMPDREIYEGLSAGSGLLCCFKSRITTPWLANNEYISPAHSTT